MREWEGDLGKHKTELTVRTLVCAGALFSYTSDTGTGELLGGPEPFSAYVTALYVTLSCMTSVSSISTNTEKLE